MKGGGLGNPGASHPKKEKEKLHNAVKTNSCPENPAIQIRGLPGKGSLVNASQKPHLNGRGRRGGAEPRTRVQTEECQGRWGV